HAARAHRRAATPRRASERSAGRLGRRVGGRAGTLGARPRPGSPGPQRRGQRTRGGDPHHRARARRAPAGGPGRGARRPRASLLRACTAKCNEATVSGVRVGLALARERLRGPTALLVLFLSCAALFAIGVLERRSDAASAPDAALGGAVFGIALPL